MDAQIITTIAGSSISGFGGDGGIATAASLLNPHGVGVDAAGNVYIADAGNDRVRKVSSSGIITTFAGLSTAGYSGDGGAASIAQLDFPVGVVADAAGNIYILDGGNSCVRKVNTSGIISTYAGTGTAGYGGDGGPATAAQMDLPAGIAIDGTGNLYIADVNNHRIRKISTAGIITTIAGTGATGFTGDGGPATAADLGFPYGVAVDGAGNVSIALYYDNRIRQVNTSGTINTIAGLGSAAFSGDGGPATAAEFDGPWGLAADAAGNLFIADNNNNRIRKINTSGIISTIAGTGFTGFGGDGAPATTAWLNNPAGVALDVSGRVFIVDYLNHRIRRVGAAGNTPPVFTGGATQSMSPCSNVLTPINTYMEVTDVDAGQTETWSIVTAPLHGTLVAAYTTTSTGGMITPTGLSYTSALAYTGMDSFTVRVTDGTAADTTKVIVTVLACGTTSLNKPKQNFFSVSPNPSSGTFTVRLSENFGNAYITVTDMTGRIVQNLEAPTTMQRQNINITLKGPDGIYFLRVSGEHGVHCEKVILRAEQ
jgi:hypothetical protein